MHHRPEALACRRTHRVAAASGQICISYEDINRGGTVICFWGTGFVNLSDYWYIFLVRTWDNMVSSWYSGVWRGTFYQYPNGEGNTIDFRANAWGNLTGTVIGNDALSSLRITGQG